MVSESIRDSLVRCLVAIPFDLGTDKRQPAQPLLSVILGGWLVASGTLLGYTHGQTINTCAVGVACILVSAIAMKVAHARHFLTLLATWLVVSTCAFPEASAVTIANNVVAAIALVWIASAKGDPARR